jgi:glycine cleavage system H protein
MNIPADLKYAKSDEWVRMDGDTATVGISDYAQNQLSDIVFVELPSVGTAFAAGAAFAAVESVKAASDVYLPLAGEITEVNETLGDTPETVNKDPYGAAWLVKFKITDNSNLGNLMDAAGYQKYCEERDH